MMKNMYGRLSVKPKKLILPTCIKNRSKQLKFDYQWCSRAQNELKTSQTWFFHDPDTSEALRKKYLKSFWPPKSTFFSFLTSGNFLDFARPSRKKWLPDLHGSVKKFLGTQHLWCGYLKHSPGSGLSNARCLMAVRHTQTKRHPVFWITVINCRLRHLLDFTCLGVNANYNWDQI